MGSINARNGNLFVDFRFKGVRCREYTQIDDTPVNRSKFNKLLKRIEAEIILGTFEYQKYFPNSNRVELFTAREELMKVVQSNDPLFSEFAEQWYNEMEHQWRTSHRTNIRQTLDRHIIPSFGYKIVSEISKADLLAFRGTLTRPDCKRKKALSASRINHIMTPVRMILNEAANQFDFQNPFRNITPLKVPRTDVEPFEIEEVLLILDKVRADYKNYYTVRFFAGLRTAEIDGLKWKYVDFRRRKILVRETRVQGIMEPTKNNGSFRDIEMSKVVFDAFEMQKKQTGNNEFVFCNREGNPLSHDTVSRYIWHPLLRHLGLKPRRPYQTRHTAATLWLASGESPEWIARQMGHTTTEMLFKVYSRYVPNLTRQDGSAFERLLEDCINLGNIETKTGDQ